MSAPAAHIRPTREVIAPKQVSQETLFWRSFKAPVVIKENNPVNHVHFNPSQPHDLAFTSSSRIQIFSRKNHQIKRTITKFKDSVFSGEFRCDGRLIIAGDATGLIQVFEVNNGSTLASFQATQHAVHVTKFHPSSLSNMLSASDDRVVRLWDLTTKEPIVEYKDHTDYVRSATFVGMHGFIASGCYDGMVRLYDPRVPSSQKPIFVFEHDEPVESVLPLNDTTIASSSGSKISIWNLTAGKKVTELNNFQKTVTCLASADEKGMLASSLDGHVKIFETQTPKYAVKYGWKYGGTVLCTAISPDLRQIAAGLTSGLLSVRTRERASKPKASQKKHASSYLRMMRGQDYHGEKEQLIVDPANKPRGKLKTYEKHIKAFRWMDALDASFEKGVTPEETAAVLNELKRRGKVAISLSNRDEDSLEPILRWIAKSIHDTRSHVIAADWIGALIDMYEPLIEKSIVLKTLFDEIRQKLGVQLECAYEAQKLAGMLELLTA